MARKINFQGKEIDYQCVSDLSEGFDAKYPEADVTYITINAAVLGNAMGKETVDGDDTSTALAAVQGRKYNNARAAFPLSRKYVDDHYSDVDQVCRDLADKMSSICAELQTMLTPEQVQAGRDVAMRSQAIREAKEILETNGSSINDAEFARANQHVRASVASKVYANFGGSVSARRLDNNNPDKARPNYKRKSISINGTNVYASVAVADMSGLKKVPIFDSKARNKAEEYVFQIAAVVTEAVSKLKDNISDDSVFTALKTVVAKIPGDATKKAEIADYTPEEMSQIHDWANEIVANYSRI